ncbi:nucleotidyltransferase domain-containing protein [Sphaerothrix gracilis]|uniref:nucleotidyltransferase family protein n=1 Tax=Sphaerothrix gracilis TaxID=3151835 RepID=UPI0031FDA7F5
MSQNQESVLVPQQIAEKQPQIEELCRRNQVARLELFGSATSNRFQDPTSDIDFLVEFAVDSPQGATDRFIVFPALKRAP